MSGKAGKVTAKTVWLKDFLDEGVPGPEHFEIVESTVDHADAKEGDIVVEIKYMSVDPYLRGQIKSQGKTEGGRRAMAGFVSGIVVASKSDAWSEGDLFGASLPFSTYQIVTKDALKRTAIWKLTGIIGEDKLSYGVGVLGMPGSTAYAGIVGVLRPEKEGETIFISAATGAVGSLAGQIAKNVFKLNVVGSAGGPDKAKLLLDKFCYDSAIDYKALDTSVKDEGKAELQAKLKEAAPDGIDMYFENVGGIHFDAAFDSLRPFGRIAVCGLVSQYNKGAIPPNNVNLWQTIYTFQRIEGFVCSPWLTGQRGSFLKDMAAWLEDGLVPSVEETFYEGIENWPTAFQSLFHNTARNTGKVVVRI